MKYLFLITLLLIQFITIKNVNALNLSSIFKKKSNDCSSVDLRNSALGEVRNQGSAGWCFAYTSADLVTHRLNKKISATDLAINFYYQMPEMPKSDQLSLVSGGSDMGSITYIKNNYCPEEVMPSSELIPSSCLKTLKKIEALDIIRFIENFTRADKSSLAPCEISFIKALYKNTRDEDVIETMNDRSLSSFMKINQLREKNCLGQRIKANSNLSMKSGLQSGVDSLKDINEQLDRKNPVSLNYDAHFLLDHQRNPDRIENHYSSIVGRRLNESTHSCQYLIRNSWGKDCTIYPEPYNTQCEDGNIWVDENILGQNILGVHYLK